MNHGLTDYVQLDKGGRAKDWVASSAPRTAVNAALERLRCRVTLAGTTECIRCSDWAQHDPSLSLLGIAYCARDPHLDAD